jgi:hypothetical protein
MPALGSLARLKVRKGRSCSSVVLAKETAEQITSAHPACLVLSDDGQPGRWIRRLEPQRPVRTVAVVVLDIDSQDLFQMPRPTIRSQSRHSARTVRTHRSANAFAFGARTGVTGTSPSSERNTWSKPGMGSHAAEVNPSGVHFDEEQHLQPLEPDRVDGEEVTGHDPGGLLGSNACQVMVVRRGAGSSPRRRNVERIAVAETPTPRRSSSPWMRW